MDITKAKKIGFNPKITLKDGIKLTMDWFLNSKQYRRYNPLLKKLVIFRPILRSDIPLSKKILGFQPVNLFNFLEFNKISTFIVGLSLR